MSFLDAIESQFKDVLAKAPAEFREQAWAAYSRLGLPDRKTETWKYSSLLGLTKNEWPLAAVVKDIPAEASSLRDKWNSKFDVLTIVNGELVGDLPAGVKKAEFAKDEIEFEDGWVGLSAAVAKPGFELRVAAGDSLAKPILIVHVQTGTGAWGSSLHRIRMGAASSASIGEIHVGSSTGYMRSEITLAHLERGAVLNWVRVQDDEITSNHFSDVQCHLANGAHLHLAQINGGASWSRSTLRADIHGEGAEAHVSGLTFARLKQHVDQRVEVRHRAGHTTSAQLFKGVLKDHSRGVLNGKIYIARGAQKVASSQLNHNLLLSQTAEADTKPELEIYADDVKANHGASIGRMDEDKVFYLMSRGITRREAQHILARAFVADVVMKIQSEALRDFAEAQVEKLLPDFSDQMEAEA